MAILMASTFNWPNAVAQAIESYGASSRTLFNEANLPYPTGMQYSYNIEFSELETFMEHCAFQCAAPDFALRSGQHFTPSMLDAFGFSVIASSNIQDVLTRSMSILKFVSNSLSAEVDYQKDHLYLYPSINEDSELIQTKSMLLSFIKKLLQLLISADYQFYRLDIDFDLDEQSKTLYENFFRCPISWNAPKLGIGLASEDILTLLPGANEELAQINEKLFMERLTSNLDSNLELRIKSLLLTHLPRGQYNKGFIAGQLNMSSRTLHNKLRRHGLSFQSLLDETRSELALSYLRQQLPINEIAHRLGYTDTSNFCRAFKRYHGYSPSNSRSKDKVIAAADR